MKTAFLDCFSGISGDMLLGALIDAGLDPEDLKTRLLALPLKGYHLTVRKEMRQHLSGTRFSVEVDPGKQPHRHYDDIKRIITESDLSRTVKSKGIEIFGHMARVEAGIHGLPLEEVHFHEVGAVDSIIDIIGALIGIEVLGIRSFYVSQIPLGSGLIETAHGPIPVPAPATVELLKGIPVYASGVGHEMVTPTGAALIKCLGTSFGAMPPMTIRAVGYGVGTRDLPDRPNLLRILIGDPTTGRDTETLVTLTTNLDDMNPEWTAFVMERLFAAGALDVIFIPIQVKKNRVGVQLQVLAPPDKREVLSDILFRESTALGIRYHFTQREILKRAEREIESPWGRLKVKEVIGKDGASMVQPEYEACRKIALEKNLPLRKIYNWVMIYNKK